MTPPSSRPPQPSSNANTAGKRGGIVGAIITAVVLLSKAKFLFTIGTALLYVWAYAQISGWPFAIGIVLLIFLHELGHVWALRRLGITVKAMVFVPLVGAFVAHQGVNRLPQGAFVALMGPVFGMLGGLVCYILYAITGRYFFLFLGAMDIFINLANLLPIAPLDGSKIVPVLAPLRRLQARAERDPYFLITPQEHRALGRAFWGLVIGGTVASVAGFVYLRLNHPL